MNDPFAAFGKYALITCQKCDRQLPMQYEVKERLDDGSLMILVPGEPNACPTCLAKEPHA